MFQYSLVKRAQQAKKHIVLPEGTDERILIAASRLIAMDLVDITLLGEKETIRRKIENLGIQLDLDKVEIIDPTTSRHFEDYANTYYELRKHKNVNLDIAKDRMSDVSFLVP